MDLESIPVFGSVYSPLTMLSIPLKLSIIFNWSVRFYSNSVNEKDARSRAESEKDSGEVDYKLWSVLFLILVLNKKYILLKFFKNYINSL